MAITISTNNSNDKLYASTSSILKTHCNNNGTNSISIYCDDTSTCRVEFLPDADGKKYNNSFAILIKWSSGADQQVVFGCSDSSVNGANWVAGTTTLTANNYVNSPASVTVSRYNTSGSKGGTVTRTTLNNYWIANFGLSPAIADDSQIDRTVGSYNNPATWYWNTGSLSGGDTSANRAKIARHVSWTKPSTGTPLYYVAMLWKGYSLDLDYNADLGSVKVISGKATSFIDQSNWWDENHGGYFMKITVHAIYTGGPNPTFAAAQNSAKSSASTGMGKSAVEDWGIWWKWQVPSINIRNIRFYEQNKSTLLTDSTDTEYDYYAPVGSRVAYPEDIKINRVDQSKDYRLDGYYKKEGSGSWGTTVLTNLGTVGSSDLSFAQKLSLKEVVITFNANGGTIDGSSTATRTWQIGSTQTLPTPSYSKTGYTITFNGWYTAASGGTLIGAAGASYTVPENAVTMYAHWTESINSYTLTTAVASASSSMGTVSGGGSKAYNSSVTVTATANNGYQFVKWVFTGSKTGESTTASTTFNMPAGSVTATAHFEARTFTLSFNAKTENYPKSSDDGGQEVTNPSGVTVTYNQKYPTLPSYNNTDFDGWKWDYTFGGWWTDAPVDGVAQGTRVYGNTASELYTTVGNQTLYAFWPRAQKKYNITWIEADLYDNLVLEQDNNVLADTAPSFDQANPVHEGYEFLGWTPVGKDQTGYPKEESQLPVVMETLTYKAVYEPISNHIIFDCQGGTPATFDPVLFNVETVPVVINSTSGGPYEITKVGYKFLGWLPFVNGEPISDTPQLVYRLTDWIDSDITLVAKYIAALSSFNPKPGDPGFDESNPDEDNDNYGIPISALDRNQKYKLKLHVDGDRTSDPVFDISEGVITKVNGVWVWDYESDILTITELEELLNNTVFVMDIWRCIVFRTTGVIKVTLETYDTDGTYLGYDDMDSPFELYDWMTPYIDGENSVDDNSDVVPVESISSIENLDLWANGLEQRFTKRFIGNGKSTISVIMTAHSKDEEHGEVLYGAVPTVYCVLLKSDDSNGGETYELKYVNSVETQADYDALFDSSDIDDISYTTKELPVNYNPFPNIQHNASKDYINATLKVRVYDSRHMQPLFDD